jgi:TolB-like protein
MLFRIGVNLGDILIEGEDILGDGVNVAARLEGIAQPGGICVSSSAYEQVRGKIPVEFVDLGEQSLKNISRPIRAYAIGLSANTHQNLPLPPSVPRLSILVLPFANIGGDPEQDYFVDGVTESLTTDLSRISGSFVIARNTAFTFKGSRCCRALARSSKTKRLSAGAIHQSSSLVTEATHGKDPDLVVAALLHDAVEDQEVPSDLIAREFGSNVAEIVAEVTDDKTVDQAERKRRQVATARKKSDRAKMLKLTDAIDRSRTPANI